MMKRFRDPPMTTTPHRGESKAQAPIEPVGTSLLFENERVRAWEMTLAPGETCPAHRHLHDYLMLYPEAAVMRSGSRSRLERADPGLVAFAIVGAEGLPEHQITNPGPDPVTHYVVELLGPSTAATAQPLEHNSRAGIEPEPQA